MTKDKPPFLRLFLGGFAIGAVALVSVQATTTGTGIIPAAHALTR
jgi:hypothetical protein